MTNTANADPTDAADRREWTVPPHYAALEGAGAVVFAILAGTLTDPVARVVAGLAAVLLAAFAIRDRIARIRLTADQSGLIVVHGYAGTKRLAWPEIEAIKIDTRARFGLSRSLLEIDAGEHLYLFSRRELGAEVDEVVRELAALRSRTGYAG